MNPASALSLLAEARANTRLNNTSSFPARESDEKQISVDPISLASRESSQGIKVASTYSRAISCSLPNSPRFDPVSIKPKRRCKRAQPPASLGRQFSVALTNLERLRETHVRRSKSCGEGRASRPSLDFDLRWSQSHPIMRVYYQTREKVEREVEEEEEGEGEEVKKGKVDKFGCGACLFLPGFGKGKAIPGRKEVPEREIVSRRMSLEKFECGSWRSSALMNHVEEEDGEDELASNLFFDLPTELIRCTSVSDTDAPVTTGFVFDDKKHHQNRRGVLKIGNATSFGRKSHESCDSSRRHVRFSTSSLALCPPSPTSPNLTPRLHRARDELSVFLEAQGT